MSKEKSYTLSSFVSDKAASDRIINTLSTIEPVDNIGRCYEETDRLYKSEGQSKYPRELLILSLMSLQGPTLESLNELLYIEENKRNNQSIVDTIKQEIDFHNQNRK